MIPLLYKVLGDDGAAIHGGSGKWPLPHDGEPGDWLEVGGTIRCCSTGLHLVVDPLHWLRKGARLYLAEPDITKSSHMDGNKGAFARARLIMEVTPDWPLLMMAPHIRCFLIAAGLWPDYKPNLRYANLSSANLSSADLSYADLRYADLRSANLRSANLRYADLRSADLRYADLSYANLSSANLRYADLRSADLRYADLRSADLRYADLRSADLRSADLRYADLRSANLSSANLSYAIRPVNPPDGWKVIDSGLLVKA